MSKSTDFKRLATKQDNLVVVNTPVNNTTIKDREKYYDLLDPNRFSKRYNDALFHPVSFLKNNQIYHIQYNFCTNPFCKWYGLQQEKFSSIKNKPSRYKLGGSKQGRNKGEGKRIICNPDPINPGRGMTFGCSTTPLSNWSLAEEIERLTRIESILTVEPDYDFHSEGCSNRSSNPFENEKEFYRRGKSTASSQKYQCKQCKKFTNVLPKLRQNTTYNQKRNDIVPLFARLLVNKTPISRTCEILNIGIKTYYHKLEWLYRRCLEFQEKYERKPLAERKHKTIWLNTDKMIYFLNNVRKKGQGGNRYDELEELQLPTQVIVSADVLSRYVFRSDVAYDWDINLNNIREDTIKYKEDHLYDFLKKNARLKYSYAPQPPSKHDTQTLSEYQNDLKRFERRNQYIEGLHVQATYTSIAHFWLLKDLLKAQEWRFITDDDKSLARAIYRVFGKEIRLGDAHHFLCMVDKTKSRKEAYSEFKEAKTDLLMWGFNSGYDTNSLYSLALHKLTNMLQSHKFHIEILRGASSYNVWANNPIEHPLASIDKGFHKVDCKTDISSYEPNEIAGMVLKVSDHSTNFFIQQIRRRLSFLERPLTTARGDGKSYIYSNFNPKYAQYALTILRTFYNFCYPYKSADGLILTPAQRLGITNKKYEINDIIYLR